MTTTDKIMALADEYADAYGAWKSVRIERRGRLRTEVETLTRQLKHAELAAAAEADEVDRLKKERAYIRAAALEEAAVVANDFLTKGRSPLGRSVADAIRALKDKT